MKGHAKSDLQRVYEALDHFRYVVENLDTDWYLQFTKDKKFKKAHNLIYKFLWDIDGKFPWSSR